MDRAFGVLALMGIVFEFFAGHAIPSLLPSLKDVAVGLYAGKKLLHNAAMAGVSGANEAVLADAPAMPKIPVALANQITMFLRSTTTRLGRALDLQSVLITTGDEHDGVSTEALISGDRVAQIGRAHV